MPDVVVRSGQVVFSFDGRVQATRSDPRIHQEHIAEARRCAQSARFARGQEHRDEFQSWYRQVNR